MIESITYKQVEESAFPWAANIDLFKQSPVINFKPGLNVIFGRNASGKSTILQLMGSHLAAVQGGTSVVTSSWARDVLGFDNKLKLPCEVRHDGQPIMYFDARVKEGLTGGAFDDDFFRLGIENTLAKGSSGQLLLKRLDRFIQVLVSPPEEEKPVEAPEVEKRVNKRKFPKLSLERKPRDVPLVSKLFPTEIMWRIYRDTKSPDERQQLIETLLTPSIPEGPKTLILDEPEDGLSFFLQAKLWENVFANVDSSRFQVIVATHSPFALGIPTANYIESSPGAIDECTTVFSALAKRFEA